VVSWYLLLHDTQIDTLTDPDEISGAERVADCSFTSGYVNHDADVRDEAHPASWREQQPIGQVEGAALSKKSSKRCRDSSPSASMSEPITFRMVAGDLAEMSSLQAWPGSK